MDTLELDQTNVANKESLGEAIQMIWDWARDHYPLRLIFGEKLTFKQLKPRKGFEFIDATVVEEPANKKLVDYNNNYPLVEVNLNISKEITVGDELTKELEDYFHFVRKVLKHEVLGSDDNSQQVKVLITISSANSTVVSSPFYDLIAGGGDANCTMNRVITEGVCYSKSKVPDELRDSLRSNIDKLAKETEVDYHPNSNDVLRDLVHPALYPYVRGVSEVETSPRYGSNDTEAEEFDFWGRPYEDSKFQWLPTPFYISSDGNCFIGEYINNLDQDKFSELYRDLERLFEVFVPYFEEVWAYANAMKAEKEDIGKPFIEFRNKELQVITKIVDYSLQPGQSYEGVWHAEGMSHENIVMTGIYFIDRDEDLVGGDLRFKRVFHDYEEQELKCLPQYPPEVCYDFAEQGFTLLGHFPTEEGYILVFPNCHIHKIAKFVNESTTKAASRRIVVFFVVNPEKKIISTMDVAPQKGKISLNDAKKYRLELMAERKYDKEKLNVRTVHLCEH